MAAFCSAHAYRSCSRSRPCGVVRAGCFRAAVGTRLLTQRGSFNRKPESSGGDFWGAVATVFVTVAPSHSPRFPRWTSPGASMAPSPAVLPPLPSLSRSVHLLVVLACPGMRVPGLPGGFPAAPSEAFSHVASVACSSDHPPLTRAWENRHKGRGDHLRADLGRLLALLIGPLPDDQMALLLNGGALRVCERGRGCP